MIIMMVVMVMIVVMVVMVVMVMMVIDHDQGWQGVNCSSRCSKSSWGEKCSETCDCEYGTCHPDNGGVDIIFILFVL